MYYLDNSGTDPYWNLALEEFLLKNSKAEYFMLWQNRPSIIIGRNQNALSEINEDYVKKHSIPVVRRLTGGGAVFHDLGNLNYTFLVNDSGGVGFDFKKHTAPIVEVLRGLSVNAELSGRNDLTIDGKKFSGNSQYRYKGRLLHHGTLLFSAVLSDVSAALKVDPSKFEGKGVKSIRSRVTNISEHLTQKLSLPEFKSLISDHIKKSSRDFQIYHLKEQEIAATERLAKEKYSTLGWNYGVSPDCNFSKRKKFSAGSVEVYMTVKDGVIRSLRIFGDFFGECEIGDIESALENVNYREEEIRQRLAAFDLSRYFSGIDLEDLLGVLF